MSCNVNSLTAMRTLLQQTQTVALDRTGAGVALDRTGAGLILSEDPEDMVVKGNAEYRAHIKKLLVDNAPCTKSHDWRTTNLKKKYWSASDLWYWTWKIDYTKP